MIPRIHITVNDVVANVVASVGPESFRFIIYNVLMVPSGVSEFGISVSLELGHHATVQIGFGPSLREV